MKRIIRYIDSSTWPWLAALLLCWCFGITGCLGTASLPPNSLTSGHLELTVGPFFDQTLTVASVSKDDKGVITVGSWQGSTAYLGVVTFKQNFTGLQILPSQTPPAK